MHCLGLFCIHGAGEQNPFDDPPESPSPVNIHKRDMSRKILQERLLALVHGVS